MRSNEGETMAGTAPAVPGLVFKTFQWLVKEIGAEEVTGAHTVEKAPLRVPDTSRVSEELSSWREDKLTSQPANQPDTRKKNEPPNFQINLRPLECLK